MARATTENDLALKSVLLPFGDIFPYGMSTLLPVARRETLLLKLVEDLLHRGAYSINIDGGFGRTDTINEMLKRLPSEFRGSIKVMDSDELMKSEAFSRHFVGIHPDELWDPSAYGSEGLSEAVGAVQKHIYYFSVAREHELTLPTLPTFGLEQVSRLRGILKEGSSYARLSNMEGVWKSYQRHEIASIDTNEYVWKYIQSLEPELCSHYAQAFSSLGMRGQIEAARTRLFEISKKLVNKLKEYQLIYRAVDLYEGTKIEKALNLLPKDSDFVPTYIGQLSSITKHHRECSIEVNERMKLGLGPFD